jgi:hypothetical protein
MFYDNKRITINKYFNALIGALIAVTHHMRQFIAVAHKY